MRHSIKTVLLLLSVMLLGLAGCKQDGDKAAEAKPPIPVPTSQNDADWRQYVGQMVGRHVKVKRGIPPFAVYISPDEDPAAVITNANQTLQRGVVKDTILAFGSRDSALMASKMSEIFKDVPEGRLKGARVVFVGNEADRATAQAAVGTTGAEFIFLPVGS